MESYHLRVLAPLVRLFSNNEHFICGHNGCNVNVSITSGTQEQPKTASGRNRGSKNVQNKVWLTES